MQPKEGRVLSVMRSVTSFQKEETQWDAGVCQGLVSQWRSSRFMSGELSRSAASNCVSLMYSPIVVHTMFQLVPRC